jgi:hypothetical protein
MEKAMGLRVEPGDLIKANSSAFSPTISNNCHIKCIA